MTVPGRGATCTFYNIPTDKELRSAWLTKIARVGIVTKDGKTVTKPWVSSKSSKLCGCHFENPPPSTCRKKWFVIPNIFSHRKTTTKPKGLPPRERHVETVSTHPSNLNSKVTSKRV
ncbi:hypothetical protein DPMN_137168 [Dreissena polymorpha]|uniref:THAP-type domain-containing protein n=1 Tax=Dreissena polymorpha TaxID=45954 RepID=A0A9D4G1D0_DREPO|nr:hypothetical protein DPMN_137168 [Dreissena polymorpha]